ncbi:MAG: DnaA/Hda family protein, partial [Verrucomicrobia bacterium]|nr:DnaA/Hda family protein [Verrucomicrobiota bacterium]
MNKVLKNSGIMEVWEAISAALKTDVSPDTFNRWFKEIQLVEIDPQFITLSVPNHIYQVWIETNYLNLLRAAVLLVLQSPLDIRFIFSGESIPAPTDSPTTNSSTQKSPQPPPENRPPDSRLNGINPKNTFADFVVGTNNQFAQAACKAVADSPAKTYNPLFIYGGVGLGKTHLMHAIGNSIAAKKKAKVVYITSEAFTNDFIDAIQNNSLIKFRKRYRQADVLLIDDIQFLADKGRTQEEFFHTFNTLFDGHKQIVLCSDRPPSEIAN